MRDLAMNVTEIDLNRDDLTIIGLNTRHTVIAGLLS